MLGSDDYTKKEKKKRKKKEERGCFLTFLYFGK